MQTSNEIANTNSRFSDTVPMNQHKIYKEMGKFKGDLFMKILPPQPCRLSGSTHEEAVEYQVPLAWERFAKEDFDRMKLEGSRDAVAEDLQLMQDVANLGCAASSSATFVKTEEKSPGELQREKIMAFKKEPATHLRKFQDQKIDIQQIQNKAEAKQKNDKYAKLLFKDCKESLDAIGEIIPVLETMMKKGTSDANVEKVMVAISVMENNIKDLNEWAAKLGYVIVSAKKRRQNKRAASDIEP